ncbi:hypothetical protein [Devosia aurantiaca]|uniref:Uncharacterized protein n=1 Tax=Devosia aurantiaca TaxID=2714858 RepID=A0A6M1T242_9HYPH|nr:hypothetical protein [Devosia aurantiaca]NGP18891.1 hypothetical protein [Devosia aurantiaca]
MTATEPLDLVWGVAGIAHVIGRTVRQTEIALAKRSCPAARSMGGG